MQETLLSCQNVSRSYLDSGEKLHVLRQINFELKIAEIATITGSSGSGKSTLLNILALLDRPDEGQVLFKGQVLDHLKHEKVNQWRLNEVGFIFQFHHLLPEFTILENVLLPARYRNGFSKDDELKAQHLLAKVGLQDRSHHMPNECSGGERQRAAVARALINDPAVVLADEPSGNLDRGNTERLHDLIHSLNSEMNQAFVIVTHDESLAAMAHRRWYLDDGVLTQK